MRLGRTAALAMVGVVVVFATGMAALLNHFKFESTVRDLQRARILLVANEIEDGIQQNLNFSAALAESQTLQALIERLARADPLIESIDIIDAAGLTLFTTEPARARMPANQSVAERLQRSVSREWFLEEEKAFIAGVNVSNSFGLRVAGVVVRYQRSGFDRTVAAMGGYLGRVGLFGALAALALGVVITLRVIPSRAASADTP
jgi:hypothetical protein